MTLAICIALVDPGAAYAATEETTRPDTQSVQLVREALGCGSFAALRRIAIMLVEHGADAARAALPAEDCQVFEAFRGSVVDEAQGAICVLEPSNSRCLWFVAKDFAPAEH